MPMRLMTRDDGAHSMKENECSLYLFVCASRRITQECRVGKGGRSEKERE